MPVFLGLIACVLAIVGLTGHGLAMLLVGFLASSASAAEGAPYFGEICTPAGLVSLAQIDVTESGESQEPHGPAQNSCPVCTAFAQYANADLPSDVEFEAPGCCDAALAGLTETTRSEAGVLSARPRAPPAAA